MSIKALLSNTHHIYPISSDRHDNLSDFRCSCGERFIANTLSIRSPGQDIPSMAAVHRAEMTLQVLGMPTGQPTSRAKTIEALPPGSVIKDATGLLIQRTGNRPTDWYSQAGQRPSTADIPGPARILWAPGME